jgi:hypothetical protein
MDTVKARERGLLLGAGTCACFTFVDDIRTSYMQEKPSTHWMGETTIAAEILDGMDLYVGRGYSRHRRRPPAINTLLVYYDRVPMGPAKK